MFAEAQSRVAEGGSSGSDAATSGIVGAAVPYPDLTYLWKLAKRHWLTSSAVFLGILGAALPVALSVKNTYKSTTVAWADARDGSDIEGTSARREAQNSIFVEFEQRFDSESFLFEISKDLNEPMADAGPLEFMRTLRERLLPKVEKEGNPEAEAFLELRPRLVTFTDPAAGTLRLEGYGSSPQQAQTLAAKAIEVFIQTQLATERDRLRLRAQFLSNELKRAEERLNAVKALYAAAHPTPAAAVPSGPPVRDPTELVSLRTREADLEDKVRIKEAELARINDDRLQQRMRLETEYKLLQARLQPGHPDLEAKRSEIISHSQPTSQAMEISAGLGRLRQDLFALRNRLMVAAPVTPAVQAETPEEIRREQNFVTALNLSQQRTAVDLADVERQLLEPGARTRLKVIKAASYATLPHNAKKRKAVAGAFGLALAAALGLFLVRELRNPLARDAWRVSLRSGCPVLTQISAQSLKQFARITPSVADELRVALSESGRRALARARSLLAYRRIELTVKRAARGKVIVFLGAGPEDRLGQFLFNFLNIVGTDLSERILVLDFNRADPIVPWADDEAMDDGKLNKTLHAFRPDQTAFDFMPMLPLQSDAGSRRVFRRSYLEKLFATLATRYDFVFVRGLSEPHFIENSALVDAASDCIVCVDAGRTTFSQIERTMVHLQSNKVRGLVMLGT